MGAGQVLGVDQKVGVSLESEPKSGGGKLHEGTRNWGRGDKLSKLIFLPHFIATMIKIHLFPRFLPKSVWEEVKTVPLSIHTIANRSYASALPPYTHALVCEDRLSMYM